MVPPHAAVDLDAVALQHVLGKRLALLVDATLADRFSHLRGRGISLQSVQPAIRSPVQTVDDLVAIADTPSGEADLDVRHIGLVVAVPIRNEQQVGRRPDEHAIETDRDRGRKDDTFHEDFAAIGDAVVVGVFEDQRCGCCPPSRSRCPARLVVAVFRDPESSAIVPAERHRLHDHRLAPPRPSPR